MINYDELDERFENTPKREKIHKSMSPVSDRHDVQARAEYALNRDLTRRKKERRFKARNETLTE